MLRAVCELLVLCIPRAGGDVGLTLPFLFLACGLLNYTRREQHPLGCSAKDTESGREGASPHFGHQAWGPAPFAIIQSVELCLGMIPSPCPSRALTYHHWLHWKAIFPTWVRDVVQYGCLPYGHVLQLRVQVPPIKFKWQSPPLQHQKSACWETLYNMASGAVQVWMRADFTHIAFKE